MFRRSRQASRSTAQFESMSLLQTLSKLPETKTPAAFHIFERLHPHLTPLTGNGGFRTLLSRALRLANAEVPWLNRVHVMEDGSLEGVEDLHARRDPVEVFEGGVVL